LKPALLLLASVLGLGLLWQGAAGAGWVDTATVPPPDEILGSLPQLLTEEDLARRFATTFLEAFAASSLAVAVGVPVGFLLHRFRLAGAAFEPWVAGIAAAPLVLLYPLFLVLIGRNVATIVVMAAVAGLPAMVLKTREGFDATHPVLLHVMRSYGFRGSTVFWKLLVPASVPTLANGVRLALMFALINVVGVEFLVNFGGLGQLIADLSDRYELAAMYGAVLFVILVSLCFFVLTERVERWLRPA
jgi:NitT/TauT family transport system permease protein